MEKLDPRKFRYTILLRFTMKYDKNFKNLINASVTLMIIGTKIQTKINLEKVRKTFDYSMT